MGTRSFALLVRVATGAAVLTVLAVVSDGGASASSRPQFTSRYAGTVTGRYRAGDGDVKVASDWKITGLRLRLAKVRTFEGGWTAFYAVVGGTVTYDEKETGACSYSIHDSYPLRSVMPPLSHDVPFSVDRNPLGRWSYDGNVKVRKSYKVLEICPDPDGGDPTTSTRTILPPTLFQDGAAHGVPGRALRGSWKYRDSYDTFASTTTWTWSLKPA